MTDIIEGSVFEIPYPFVRTSLTLFDVEGSREVQSWRPGTEWKAMQSYDDYHEDYSYADAMGFQILAVISVHKPGKYPERVFYTRSWKSPAGNIFGKPQLRVKALSAFKRDLRGYRHPFTILPDQTEEVK